MNNKQPKDIIVLQHDELAFHPERYPEPGSLPETGRDSGQLRSRAEHHLSERLGTSGKT